MYLALCSIGGRCVGKSRKTFFQILKADVLVSLDVFGVILSRL